MSEGPEAAKLQVIRDYLQSEFAGSIVYDFYEHQRAAQLFQVKNGQGGVLHLAALSDDFFEAHAEADIRRALDRHRLGRALREAGASDVLVTAGGVRVAKS